MVWWSKYDVGHRNRVDDVQVNRKKPSLVDLAHFLSTDILTQLPSTTRLTPIAVSFEGDNAELFNLVNIIESGMNIALVRISHLDDFKSVIIFDTLRKALKVCCEKNHVEYWPLAMGISLRSAVCYTENCHSIHLCTSDDVILTNDLKYKCGSNRDKIYVSYQNLKPDVKKDMTIFIDYGTVVLKCLELISESDVRCTILSGGVISARDVVIFQGAKYSVPNLAQIDYTLIEFVKGKGIDLITVPYTRNAKTIAEVRQALGRAKRDVKIFAGICEVQGIEDIENIIKIADGILLQRDTLAFEVKNLRLIIVLNHIIGLCIKAHKPLLFSDHMTVACVESAGVSDITQLLMTGISGLMVMHRHELLDSTLRSVVEISRVCKTVEPVVDLEALCWPLYDEEEHYRGW